jgi:predicted phage tail protein
MKQNKVNIIFHGLLGKAFKSSYSLYVNSVGEAMKAIDIVSGRKLFPWLANKDKEGVRYRVLINGRDFLCETPPTLENPESIANSELVMPLKNLETIDIVPVLEGAELDSGWGAVIIGALLIVVGVVLAATGYGAALAVPIIIAGIGLVAAGVIALLSRPPQFEDFREVQGGGRTSYLFNGPQNTVREGGPVPVGYGRLMVGSQVIAASYEVTNMPASDTLTA